MGEFTYTIHGNWCNEEKMVSVLDEVRFLVTGGAGFIGSHLIVRLLKNPNYRVCNLDALSYAADLKRLASVESHPHYRLAVGSITDGQFVEGLINDFRPHVVINFAAESHVDNSIERSDTCIQTNIIGTHVLLEASRRYWQAMSDPLQTQFRYYQVSTDEVYGDSGETQSIAIDGSPYRPSSPYSASKAAADHLVRAWHRTYGLPVLISTSCNNYGPGQHREKLIPKTIATALAGEPITVYGDGMQQRDWVYVEDHVAAIELVVSHGVVGRTYAVSLLQPVCNRDLVERVCGLLEDLAPDKPAGVECYRDLIQYVTDRPGHDSAYATRSSTLRDMGWKPRIDLETGLRLTLLHALP